jgi:hypothetical protein
LVHVSRLREAFPLKVARKADSVKMWKHFIFAMAFIAAGPVNGATLINTGSGTPNQLDGYTLSADQSLAARFTVAGPAKITGVNGWIGAYETSMLTINLFADGGQTPGALLHSASTAISIAGRENATWRGIDGQSWLVAPGTYWVGFASSNLLTMVPGVLNPIEDEAYFGASNARWIENDGLNLGVQIFGDAISAPSAVPEPATWVMMMIGFGAVGFGLRSRRKRHVAVNDA